MQRKLPSQTLSQREKVLWLKSRTSINENGCWEWQSTLQKTGYGKIQEWLHKSRLAHRAMYSLSVSPIPNGMYVLHSCDNRKCINPEHLWLGNHSENQKDKVSKGRHNYKFSDDDVSQIKRFASYGIQRIEILRAFKISTFWFDKIVKEGRRSA